MSETERVKGNIDRNLVQYKIICVDTSLNFASDVSFGEAGGIRGVVVMVCRQREHTCTAD